MKLIQTVSGVEFQVSDEDEMFCLLCSWTVSGGYIRETTIAFNKQYLHILIASRMGLCLENLIDHEDRNVLNNQRTNLRSATRSQNLRNSSIKAGKYKGVHYHAKNRKFIAQIKVNSIGIYLGSFDTPVEAAVAYNKAATHHFGEFANLNEVS